VGFTDGVVTTDEKKTASKLRDRVVYRRNRVVASLFYGDALLFIINCQQEI
jgi:hypothetical protein